MHVQVWEIIEAPGQIMNDWHHLFQLYSNRVVILQLSSWEQWTPTNLHKGETNSSISSQLKSLQQKHQQKDRMIPILGGHYLCHILEKNGYETFPHACEFNLNNPQKDDLPSTMPQFHRTNKVWQLQSLQVDWGSGCRSI